MYIIIVHRYNVYVDSYKLYCAFHTFAFHSVSPHRKVIKGSQANEADEAVEILQLVLNGCASDCPAMVYSKGRWCVQSCTLNFCEVPYRSSTWWRPVTRHSLGS